MSENEVESFEIPEYDLDKEFNTARPRRKLSRKQQMLGIWADDSNEDELSARPSFKTFSKDPKNYMAPVNFVAGGSQQAGKLKEKEDEDDEEDKEEREAKHSSSSSADQRPNSESRTPLNLDSLRKKRNKVEVKRLQGVCTSQLQSSWEVHRGLAPNYCCRWDLNPVWD